MFKNSFILILVVAGMLTSACNDPGEEPVSECVGDFDQPALFDRLANGLILPAYQELKVQTDQLFLQTEDFLSAPSGESLNDLKTQLYTTRLVWQDAAAFEFGPAEEVFLRSSLNNFPVNTEEVDANLSSGAYDFDQPERFDKGFPAIEYLLFAFADEEAAILDAFTNNTDLRNYLTAMVSDIRDKVDYTLNSWENGYASTFIQNTGTSAGSSLSLIINNLNQYFEVIKRDQIGIPSGVLTLGFTNPENVEAPYSMHSLNFAKAALDANQRFYLGDNDEDEGLGLDDLLRHVNAQKNGSSLDQLIQSQYQAGQQALEAINETLKIAVDAEAELVSDAYTELTKNVVLLKTDMPSVLCISITYIDNPSDSD